jgi:seryl-tRNA synthetase
MRNQSSSSKNVIAALVAAALGLTAVPAFAQTQSHQSSPPASQRPASKKSVKQLAASVKRETDQMRAANARLRKATANLKQTTHRMKQAQAKELRVAKAEHGVRNSARKTSSAAHPRRAHPANSRRPR